MIMANSAVVALDCQEPAQCTVHRRSVRAAHRFSGFLRPTASSG